MRKLIAVIGAAAVVASGLVVGGATEAASAAGNTPLTFRGTSVLSKVSTRPGTPSWSPTNEFAVDHEYSRAAAPISDQPGGAVVPRPSTTAVGSGSSALKVSFEGLNHFDQRYANGGNQFSLEPPDQGLCAGPGGIIEGVNTAIQVYSAKGVPLSGVVDINSFFGLSAEFDRTTGVVGEFTSDPKCYYDNDTGHYFMTILEQDAAPSTNTYTLIATSVTGDPTGAWNIYWLNTTNDGTGGTPSHASCPCFGDQPLIGADRYGFYVSNNEFGVAGGFNGAQLYAMSKVALERAQSPAVQMWDNIPLGVYPAYSVQPATSPTAASYSSANNGTEYLMSALDYTGTVDNRIAVWSLTNTRSLTTAHPNVILTSRVIPSESYGQPPVADQKDGSTPFGTWGDNYFYGDPANQPLNTLNTNDDRMQQVVYAHGRLWAGLNTVVAQGDAQKAGVAWFSVSAQAEQTGPTTAKLAAQVQNQGYISIAGNNVMFPSIGVTPAGKAVIAVTLSGRDYYPSAAYAVYGGSSFGRLQVAGAGVGPADGFTGYAAGFPPGVPADGVERWGDYSAAVSTPNGTVWVANEYIAQTCTVDEYMVDRTCGGTRTTLANWSTRVSAIVP